MKKIIILSATMFSLVSCGIYSKYQASEKVTQDIYGDIDSSIMQDTTSFGDMSWRDLFTDVQLQSLIDQALENNVDLLSAQENIKSAEAGLKSARLNYLPSVSLQPNGSVSGLVEGGGSVSTYSIPVVASWEIELFGRITNSKEKAKVVFEQSKDYEQAVKTQIVATVANLYYTLLMFDAQLKIAQETENSWAESVNSAKAMMDAGMLNQSSVSQTIAAYCSVQTAVLDLKEQINKCENSMSLVLASTPKSFGRGELQNANFPESFTVGVPLLMLSNRPDVRIAEKSLAQAYYDKNIARSAFYPTLTLSGLLGWTNNASGVVLDPAKLIYNATATLTQPIFNKGLNKAQLEVAKAELEKSRLLFEQTLLNSGSEVNDALVSFQTAKSKSLLYSNQVSELSKSLESTSLLMQHGSTTYFEVLSVKQSLLGAQLEEVSNKFSQIQSVITLYNALGGGRF